jgi:hypothetical protein
MGSLFHRLTSRHGFCVCRDIDPLLFGQLSPLSNHPRRSAHPLLTPRGLGITSFLPPWPDLSSQLAQGGPAARGLKRAMERARRLGHGLRALAPGGLAALLALTLALSGRGGAHGASLEVLSSRSTYTIAASKADPLGRDWSWTSIPGAAAVEQGTDGRLSLPFPFAFLGTNYSRAWLQSPGYLTFADTPAAPAVVTSGFNGSRPGLPTLHVFSSASNSLRKVAWAHLNGSDAYWARYEGRSTGAGGGVMAFEVTLVGAPQLLMQVVVGPQNASVSAAPSLVSGVSDGARMVLTPLATPVHVYSSIVLDFPANGSAPVMHAASSLHSVLAQPPPLALAAATPTSVTLFGATTYATTGSCQAAPPASGYAAYGLQALSASVTSPAVNFTAVLAGLHVGAPYTVTCDLTDTAGAAYTLEAVVASDDSVPAMLVGGNATVEAAAVVLTGLALDEPATVYCRAFAIANLPNGTVSPAALEAQGGIATSPASAVLAVAEAYEEYSLTVGGLRPATEYVLTCQTRDRAGNLLPLATALQLAAYFNTTDGLEVDWADDSPLAQASCGPQALTAGGGRCNLRAAVAFAADQYRAFGTGPPVVLSAAALGTATLTLDSTLNISAGARVSIVAAPGDGMTLELNATTRGAGPLFLVAGGGGLNLTHTSLTALYADTSSQGQGGGLVQVANGSVAFVTGGALTGGRGARGAAVDVAGGSLAVLTDVTVTGHQATWGGGALAVTGAGSSLVLQGVNVSANEASGQGGGGGIYVGPGASLRGADVTVSRNTAQGAGGGVMAATGFVSLRLERASVDHNTAGSRGGGLWAGGTGALAVSNDAVLSHGGRLAGG